MSSGSGSSGSGTTTTVNSPIEDLNKKILCCSAYVVEGTAKANFDPAVKSQVNKQLLQNAIVAMTALENHYIDLDVIEDY